ncbi:MAG TPA: hypothetical protein VFF28_01070 [Candidatus Nanoarchaeia archaeon]|nr:hypothetical protein [Candidatus Nanoarchaeia archaeon]
MAIVHGMDKESSSILASMKKKHAQIESEVEHHLEKKELCLPVSIFSENLGMLESAVIYLRDTMGLRFTEIAKLVKRDYKTVWASYTNGKIKSKR